MRGRVQQRGREKELFLKGMSESREEMPEVAAEGVPAGLEVEGGPCWESGAPGSGPFTTLSAIHQI